jgi:hypothetical protein
VIAAPPITRLAREPGPGILDGYGWLWMVMDGLLANSMILKEILRMSILADIWRK